MPAFSQTSLVKLATAHPKLQEIAHEVIKVIDHTIMQGHRNKADQDKAFAEGKSKLKWPDGNHNSVPSKALDVAPVYFDAGKSQIDWKDLAAFGRLMGAYQMVAYQKGIKLRFGLDWDGDFRTVDRDPTEDFLDAPHVEIVL